MSGMSSKDPLYQDLKETLRLHRKHFSTAIGKTAYLATKQNQLSKEVKLPDLDDIVKFTQYINRMADDCYNELLKNGFHYKPWYNLNCALLLQIVVFNRRRPGEASRIALESFNKRDAVTAKDYKHMNRLEILLSKQFVRVLTLGKRYRKLAILLRLQQVEHIKMLISMRTQAGVENNKYLFANSSSEGHFHVNAVIRKWAENADLVHPELLRCTLLRKQVATMAQYMNLTDADLRLVADGMGHDLSVHLQNYRQPEVNNQITKLSRFFMAVGDGDVARFKGKSLGDLEMLGVDDDDDEGDDNHGYDGGDADQEPKTPTSTPSRHGTSAFIQGLNVQTECTMTPCGANMTPRSRAIRYSKRAVVVLTPLKKERLQIVIPHRPENYKAKTTGAVTFRKKREKWTAEQQGLMQDYFRGKLMKRSYAELSYVEEFVSKYKMAFKDRTARHVYSWLQYRIKQ